MAKGKKKMSELTLEEKLQAVLVPKEEQSYKVPENWCWTHLGNYIKLATDYVANGSFASLKANVRVLKDKGYALMVKTQDFSNNFTESLTYTDKHGYDFLEKSVLFGGELILSNIGSIGKVFRVPYFNFPMTLASNSIMIKCFNDTDYDFLYYYFLSPMGQEKLHSITTGTAVLKFNKTDLKTIILPIPPQLEQKRIVSRIEFLFSQLNEAKDKVQEVIDGFDSRRSAILAQAFSGKLTEKWRKENSVKNSWKIKKFDEVAEIKSNLVNPSEYQDFPHIAPDNIEKRTGVLLEYHTIAEDGVTSGKHRFVSGQILYSKIRPYLSKVVMVDFEGLCSADMYPIEAKQNTRFLWYYMLSDEFLEAASSAGSRSVLPKINQKELSKIPIRITSNEDEQREVARILDGILAKENEARIIAEAIVNKIEEVKKSILAKAFRGELGTNDLSDEPAEELLKRILEEAPVEEKKKSIMMNVKVDIAMNKDMLGAVRETKRITPETLKQETGLGIDEFYEELKKLTESGKVKEVRESGEVYLEVKDAD